jgi:cyclopropane-fatty-acyl-phospholipid synthase
MTLTTAQNPGASAKAIQHHYDLSNEFYQLWLDRTCTYSCALWQAHDNLESAQIQKIDFHIENARVKADDRILDVGCGWGSTLDRLVGKYQVRQAVGLTLSQTQAQWIQEQARPKVEVKLESWSAHTPSEPYNGIISIGAFEHFAKLNHVSSEKIAGYRAFFQQCHQWLKPGGCLSLQTIVYGNAKPEDFNSFLATEIFPETDLPRLAEIAEASECLFEIVTLRNDRSCYERTCRAWLANLKQNRIEAVRLVGEETVARYEKYLQLAIVGFYSGKLGLLRMAMQRIDRPYRPQERGVNHNG